MIDQKQISIYINSCDKYSDIWPTFFSIFWKYWPDCPFPIFLGTGKKPYQDHRIQMIFSGDDHTWADTTRKVINQIPSDYVLMLLEDFFFYKRVETNQIIATFQDFLKVKGGYIRLKPFPKPDRKILNNQLIGEILPGAPYRCALQAAIWRRDVLLSILKEGETAWDMELYGSRRSDAIHSGFFSTWKPVMNYEAGVTLGKWLPWVVQKCKRENIPIDLSTREVLSPFDYFYWKMGNIMNSIIYATPWQKRRPIGNILRKLKLLPPRISIDE